MASAIGLGFVMAGFSNGSMFWGVQYISSGLGVHPVRHHAVLCGRHSVPLLGERLSVGQAPGHCHRVRRSGAAPGQASAGALRPGPGGPGRHAALRHNLGLPLVLLAPMAERRGHHRADGGPDAGRRGLPAAHRAGRGGAGQGPYDRRGLVAVAYMAIVSGFLGFVLYFWLVRSLAATRLSLTSFITPGVAVSPGSWCWASPSRPTCSSAWR